MTHETIGNIPAPEITTANPIAVFIRGHLTGLNEELEVAKGLPGVSIKGERIRRNQRVANLGDYINFLITISPVLVKATTKEAIVNALKPKRDEVHARIMALPTNKGEIIAFTPFIRARGQELRELRGIRADLALIRIRASSLLPHSNA